MLILILKLKYKKIKASLFIKIGILTLYQIVLIKI